MNKETYIDYLTSYCGEQGITQNAYFNTYTAPHLCDDYEMQKVYLMGLIDTENEYIAIFEFSTQKTCKGWHVHTLSTQQPQHATHTTIIYDLQGVIEYLAKQAYSIKEPIHYKRILVENKVKKGEKTIQKQSILLTFVDIYTKLLHFTTIISIYKLMRFQSKPSIYDDS